MNKIFQKIINDPILLFMLPLSLIPLIIIIIISPIIRIRIALLHSDRLGHFTANTELYLCEQDLNKSKKRQIDLHYLIKTPSIYEALIKGISRRACNNQIARMWKRELNILPFFLLRPLDLIIRSFKGLSSFHALAARGGNRDLDNLLKDSAPHLSFTSEEDRHGKATLISMGMPEGAKFVCLNVRDNAYHSSESLAYHDYRNTDIQNYVLASEELCSRGYFVIRMGKKVNTAILSDNPMIIDYATNGMRSDFMDVYLGAKCNFCITVGSGFDGICDIFRRPIVEVNHVPICSIYSWGTVLPVSLFKHFIDIKTNRELTLNEIIKRDLAFSHGSSYYEEKGVRLEENSAEEIRDAVVEMEDRLAGNWQNRSEDEVLQDQFWKIYLANMVGPNGVQYHGSTRSNYSAKFLRNNKIWLS